MIQTILVDDEWRQLEGLRLMLRPFADKLQVVACCGTPDEAIRKIRELSPDLVFLNAHMPGKNAFDLLDEIGSRDFKVVFTTGQLSFEDRTARYAPLGYLYKPFDEDDLAKLLDAYCLPTTHSLIGIPT